MRKKLITILIVILAVTPMLFAGGSSEEAGAADPVREAVAAAEGMTLEELEAAAKAEFEAAGTKFTARSVTSGMKKVLSGFQAKYDWFDYNEFSSSKDYALYTELSTALGAGEYVCDVAMLQDGSSMKSLMIDTGYMVNYVPKADIADENKDPLTALYGMKNFIWNKTEIGTGYLQNVWQLTGVDGAELEAVHQLSFQNPSGENVNMNFLIMLTSEDSCARLAAAYESYFGKPYEAEEGYKNIGYKFVTEMLGNVSTWHSSDTTAVKNLPGLTTGQLVYAPFNKMKDYPADYTTDLAVSGWNLKLEGFDSYLYRIWVMIPETAKLPYTSCLLIEYLFTTEGFKNGWNSAGYYSVNPEVPVIDGDLELTEWVKTGIVEDIDYIDSVYKEASTYIRSLTV